MRILKLPNAHFLRVAYVGAQKLLTIDTQEHGRPMRLWDLSRDQEPTKLTPEQAELARVAFKLGGECFLRAQGAWHDGEALPDVAESQRIQKLFVVDDHPAWQPFAFGPDGATVLFRHAGRIDEQYRTHFHLLTPDGAVHDLYHAWGMFTTSAAFSLSGRRVALSNGMKIVSVWDVTERREVIQLEQSDKVSAVEFVSEEYLVVTAGRSVRLWNVNEGRSISKFRAFRKFADALAVSPDRKLFAAGSRDGVVRVWDTASGREVKEYSWGVGEVRNLAFSPDGATAAAAGVSAVAIWDVD